MSKLQKRILITFIVLVIIGYLRIDTVLIGENFIWTAFFILLGLGLIFQHIEGLEKEIERLHSPKDKKEEEKQWGEHLKELAERDPRSFDPFYLSDTKSNIELKKQIANHLNKKDDTR